MARTKSSDASKPKVEKPPEIYMIATVFNSKKQLIGARIIDINDKKKKYQDVSIQSCVNVLKSNGLAIKNIRLDPESGQLRLVNGALSNLTKIDVNGKPMEGVNFNGTMVAKTPILVVNQISNLGYTVLNYKGEMRKVAIDKLLEEIKVVGIANGVITYKPELNMDFIVGIEEPYDIIDISKSKVGSSGVAKMRMAMPSQDSSVVAKNASIDIENQINYSDVFNSLNPQQKKCVQNYYMWYTVDMYRSLAKTTRFELNVAKAEKLATLREDKNWEFGGIVDSYTTGLLGGSKCSLGHNIRYEYHAVVFDDKGDVTDRIIFGETCSSDFFSISVEDMRKLVKVRKKMSEEIEKLTDAVANNQVPEMWDGVKLLKDCITKIGPEKTLNVFGDKVGKTLLNYINFDIPFPESLVKLARAMAYGGVHPEDSNGSKFWSVVFPEYKELISNLYSKNKQSTGYYANQAIRESCNYIDFMCYNKLDGVYAYDPFLKTGKGEGGFNAKTRDERSRLLRSFKSAVLCSEFTLEEIKDLLDALNEIEKGYSTIELLYPDCKKNVNDFRQSICNIFGNYKLHEIYGEDTVQQYTNRFSHYLILNPDMKYYHTYNLGGRLERYSSKNLPKYTNIKGFKTALINNSIDFRILNTYLKKLKELENADEELRKEEELKAEQAFKEEEERREKERKYKILSDAIDKYIGAGIDVGDNQTYISAFKDSKAIRVEKLDDLLVILTYKDSDSLLCVTNKCGKYTFKNYSKLKELPSNLYGEYYDGLGDELNNLKDFCNKLTEVEKDQNVGSRFIDEKVTKNDRVEEILKEMGIYEVDKVQELKKYFELKGIKSEKDLSAYYDKITFSICSKNIPYNNLSYKQKFVIDKAYDSAFKEKKEDNEEVKDKDNRAVAPFIMDKVNFILSNTDTSTELGAKIAEAVNKKDAIAINICKTIKRTGRASDKQIKHINNVYHIVRNGG